MLFPASDSAKQEHQSWGGDDGKRELEAETAGGADAAAEKTNADGTATPAVADGAEGTDAAPAAAADAAPATPAEPEDNSKTYEEYLKERQAAANSKFGVPEARKANEGADDSQWKDGVAITKPAVGEDNYYVGAQKEKAAKNKVRKEKNFIEVDFQPSPRPERGQRGERGGERGRGGRGRGEGGRGRGEGRGRGRGAAPRGGRPNGASANFNPDDSSAFPSLS